MAGNIQNVSFVNPLDPQASANLALQQQQAQQNLAMAQALRDQANKGFSVPSGSRASPVEAIGKLAQIWASKGLQNKANTQGANVAVQQAQMMQKMFGINPQPSAQAAATGAALPGAQQLAPQATPPAQVPNPTYGSGGVDDNGQQSPTMPAPPTDQVSNVPQPQAVPAPQGGPPPQADPSQAPQVAPQAPQQGNGPMNLTGNPMQDYSMYAMNPDEYTKQLIASHAPVDMAKTIAQARDAMSRGDIATANALLGNVQKQNYIAPIEMRPGATAADPMNPSHILAVAPQNIEGANPTIGQDGKWTGGYQQAPGAAGAIASAAAAKAGGTATYNPQQVFDPATGAPVFSTQAQVAQSAQGGHPLQAGPALGAQAAANVTGTNSANAFQDISNGAADVPNRIYALNQMAGLANNPNAQFGAGSEGANHFRGVLATISQSAGIAAPDPTVATNANEFQKWATQYSARSGQELGLSGSDARTQLAVHATPNGEMTRQALQSVIPQMVGIENAKQGYANAANVWQQQHGPQTVQQFRTEWNKVYDPSIYTHMSQGPQAFASWAKSLSPQQAAQVRSKYLTLKQIGALPQ